MNAFNTALYLRLSRDDGVGSESESIQNQKSFLIGYAKKYELKLTDIYIDDGWSGTNFDRPEFKRLLNDIEAGRINCVITKDLSRLGRDYILTGHYTERYFPQHNVRYIAVNDGIDTFKDSAYNDMTPFKAVFNDMYAKDISKKVRTALNTKKENGIFIGSVPPYGYKKDPLYKGHLIVDECTADIVKRIFDMYLSGETARMIADRLTLEHVPTPSESKHLKATQKHEKGRWNDTTIRRILTNPTYAGNLTQNRAKKINYKICKKQNLPREQWITVSNTHEPIISKEKFDAARQLSQKRVYIKSTGGTHLLSGLAECGSCRKRMTFTSSATKTYAICSSWKKNHESCTPHKIRAELMENEITEVLREHIRKYIDKSEITEHVNMPCLSHDDTERLLNDFLKLDNPCNSIFALLIQKIVVLENETIKIYFDFKV